jgi:alpha-L-rhamnosidase
MKYQMNSMFINSCNSATSGLGGFLPGIIQPASYYQLIMFALLCLIACRQPYDPNRAPEAPTNLLMDLMSVPLGVENQNPVMSWTVNDPDTYEYQTAYQILLSDCLDQLMSDHGDFWDSWKIYSSESSNVSYEGQMLEPDRVYYWKVRTWDKIDQKGPYSQPQMFTTAVRDQWLADPIWGRSQESDLINDDFVFLRKSFDLPEKEILTAIAHVTALSPEPANQYVYKLYLNGEFVGAGPPRGYTRGKIIPAQTKPSTRDADVINRYNTFDVTKLLRAGQENVVGAFNYTTEDKRFLFQMRIEYVDGTHEMVVSDDTWKAFAAGNKAISDMGNISFHYYHAPREGIDANYFPFGWSSSGFDDKHWTQASAEEPIGNLIASATLNTERYLIEPEKIIKKGKGHYFIDFGKSHVGGFHLNVDGIEGQEVEIRFGEELAAPEEVRFNMRTGNIYHEVWTLKEGTQTIENWGYRVFRYTEVLNVPEPFDLSIVRAAELRQPFNDEASYFSSSDTILNDVWDICKFSIKALSLDMYVDTHTRERLNYEGGILTEQLSDYTVHGEYAFPRFSIEHPYYRPTWPTEGKQNSVMMAWRDYMYTGNCSSLRLHYEALKTKTLEDFVNEDYLVEKDIDAGGQHGTYGRDMVDWPRSELDGFQFTSINTVINAFNYQAVSDLSDIARILGETEDEAYYSELAGNLRQAINKHLYDSREGKYRDGKNVDHYSLHASAIPLSLGIVDSENVDRVADYVEGRGMKGSVYLAQFILDGLYMSDRGEAALRLMNSTELRSWGNMIYNLDATIVGEAWDPSIKGNMSYSHPWASAPANAIPRGMFGIIPLEPGFRQFQIKPQPALLEWAKLTTPSIKGPISVEFNRNGSRFEMTVQIPVNTTADVYVPMDGARDIMVKMNGRAAEGRRERGYFVVEGVGSGRHKFLAYPVN